MRDARESIEGDGIAAGVATQPAPRLVAQPTGAIETLVEIDYRAACCSEQLTDLAVALALGRAEVGVATLVDLAEPVSERLDEEPTASRVVEQVIFEVGVALHRPDVAEDFIEHARRAAGASFAAQFIEHRPRIDPEQADDDLAVRKRGVVVRDLADARRSACRRGEQRQFRGEGVHIRRWHHR